MTQLRIGISGASGFIGQHLMHKFLKEGHEVVVMSRNSAQFTTHPKLFVVESDLSNPDALALAEFVKGLDILYHLAAELNNPDRIYATNVNGTKAMLNALKGHKTRLVHLSSMGIFAFPKNTILREDSPKGAQNPYEKSKLAAEELVLKAQKENALQAVMLRPSIVVGKSMKSALLLQFIQLIKKRINLNPSSSVVANFVLAEDLINALILVGQHPKAIGQQYNFSNDLPLKQLLLILEKEIDQTIILRPSVGFFQGLLKLLQALKLMRISKDGIAFFTNTTQISTAKIQRELGFEFTKDYRPFLQEYVNCHR